MALENQWVGYLDRSYKNIKNSLLKRLGATVPEVTDHSESNILVVIVSMFSGITEMLNYYIDNMAQEAFISTARKYSSMVKLTRLIDYRVKAGIPASVDITLTFVDPIPYKTGVTQFTIPGGTEFTTANGIKYITLEDTIVKDNPIVKIPLSQKTFSDNILLGTTSGAIDQKFSLGEDYVHDSIILTIGGEVWERKDTLGRSGPTDKHYIVEVSEDRKAYVVFGDNINGKIPVGNQQVYADYYTTKGSAGNVNANTITGYTFDFTQYLTDATVEATNELAAVAGTDYESIERIRRSAPLSLRTLDRAVTRQDFIDVTKLAPGVDKVALKFECGEKVQIYISPNDGGIAQSSLLSSTKNYVDERRTLNTRVSILPAGESKIYLKLDVTAKLRRNGIQTKSDITQALLEGFSYDKSDVNKPIRKSDIIALVDNLEKVDFLNLTEIYLIPYFRPVEHNNTLNKTFEVLKGSKEINHWEVRFFGGTTFKLFKNLIYEADITIGTKYVDNDSNFSITISSGTYNSGDGWEFTTYPYNENIETDDFTVPVLKEENLSITVNEQLIPN